MLTYDYLKELIKGINANKGTVNYGHCALRVDDYLAQGRNLALPAVPRTSAQLFTHPLYKKGRIVRSTSTDNRLTQKTATDPKHYREICDFETGQPVFTLDITEPVTATAKQVRLLTAKAENIAEKIKLLPRRAADKAAYGFIVLTLKKSPTKGHIINFYVDGQDKVYFIDAQSQRITETLDMTHYEPEIFYLASKLPKDQLIKQKGAERKPNLMPPAAVAILKNPLSESTPMELDLPENLAPRSTPTNPLALLFDDVKVFQALLEEVKNKPSADTLIKLGDCYRIGKGINQDYSAAADAFRQALELNAKSGLAWYGLGFCHKTKIPNDLAEAIHCFKQAVACQPDHSHAWNNLGNFHSSGSGTNKNIPEAIACFQKALTYSSGPDTSKNLYNLGVCYSKLTPPQNTTAFQHFIQAHQSDITNIDALKALSRCYRKGKGIPANPAEAKHYEEKIKALENPANPTPVGIIPKEGTSSDPRVQGPAVENNPGKPTPAPAVPASARAVVAEPKNPELDEEQNLLALWRGVRPRNEEQTFLAVLKETQERPSALNLNYLGNFYMNASKPNLDAAFSCYQKAHEINPKFSKALLNLGFCYLKGRGVMMDKEKAFGYFSEALQFDPTYATAWIELGRCKQKGLGTEINEEEAFNCYTNAKRVKPENAQSWYDLGYCYEFGIGTPKNFEASFNHYRQAIELKFKLADAWGRLGNCYLNSVGTSQNAEEAINCFQQAFELEPKSILYCLNLAKSHLISSNPQKYVEAIISLKKAEELEPNNIQVLILLRDSYEKNTQLDKAAEYANKIKALQNPPAIVAANIPKPPAAPVNLTIPTAMPVDMPEDTIIEPSFTETLQEYQALLAQQCPSATSLLKLGVYLFSGKAATRNLDLAFKYFSKAVNLDPKLGEAWFALACAYKYGWGDKSNAVIAKRYCLEAVNQDVSLTRAWILLGWCHQTGFGTEKNASAAIICYEKAINDILLDKNKSKILYNIGLCHFNVSPPNPGKAFDYFKKAYKLDSKNIDNLKLLEWCYQTGVAGFVNPQQAKIYANKIKELEDLAKAPLPLVTPAIVQPVSLPATTVPALVFSSLTPAPGAANIVSPKNDDELTQLKLRLSICEQQLTLAQEKNKLAEEENTATLALNEILRRKITQQTEELNFLKRKQEDNSVEQDAKKQRNIAL